MDIIGLSCDVMKNEIFETAHYCELSFNKGSSFGKLGNDDRGMYFYDYTYTNQIKWISVMLKVHRYKY